MFERCSVQGEVSHGKRCELCCEATRKVQFRFTAMVYFGRPAQSRALIDIGDYIWLRS